MHKQRRLERLQKYEVKNTVPPFHLFAAFIKLKQERTLLTSGAIFFKRQFLDRMTHENIDQWKEVEPTVTGVRIHV